MPPPQEIFDATENFQEDPDQKIIKSFTLTETPDMEHMKKMHLHPDLRDEERKRMRGYCDAAIRNDGEVEVEYGMYRKYGRYFATDNKIFTGLTMNRRARSTFFGESDSDIDLKACHPKLVKFLCPEVKTEGLDHYIENRDDFINQFNIDDECIAKYNKKYKYFLTKKDIVKNLVTRTLYGGGTKNWFKDFEMKPFILPQVYLNLRKEIEFCRDVVVRMDKFKEHNKETVERYLNIERAKHEKMFPVKKRYKKGETKPPEFNPDNFECPQRKLFCVILQDLERQIIEESMEFAKKDNRIVTMYAYDGFQIKNEGDSDDFVQRLNQSIGKKWKAEFDLKEFSEEYTDFHKIELPLYFDKKEFEYIVDQDAKKKYFNKVINEKMCF